MSNIYTDSDIKEIGLTFNNFDPKYIKIVNNGTIERRYLKPLMNDFYPIFKADPNDFQYISDDVKRAVAFLVVELAIARNGMSKTQNLGELQNHTRNSKQADEGRVNIKRDEFYTEAVMLLLDVANELLANPESYTDFKQDEIKLEVSFRNTTGLI